MAPSTESKPPSTRTGKAFKHDERQRELHAEPRAPQKPADQRREAGGDPGGREDRGQAQADRAGGVGVGGRRPEGETNPGVLEKGDETSDHQGRHRRGEQIEFGDEHTVDVERRVADADIEPMHLPAPEKLRAALDDVGEAERRHEQRDWRPVGERPQHARSIVMPISAIAANTMTSESGAGTPRSTSDT